MTRFNPQIIHGHLSYTTDDIATALKVNKKTIFRWIGEGLPVVPGPKKPMLIMGSDLKIFIRLKNSKKKVQLKRHEFYCLKCKAAQSAKRGTIKKLNGRKTGECRVCSGKMSRTI